jgi:hypothetical protein
MNPIDPLSFQRIITAHGHVEGAAYFDAEESLAHEVFADRIVFQTNYLDYRSIDAVNALAPLRQLGIEIPAPERKAIDAINRANNWERALLQYFNAQLEAHDLKLLAIGTHFDEYQAFACLPMNGLGLINALEIMGRLGIVYKY